MRDLRLGRLRFVTAEGELKESLGDALEATGAAVSAGDRRARAFPLKLPVRGHPKDQNPGSYQQALRLRRQVRALMENAPARLEGLWFDLAFDPELSGWLLVGSGELSAQDGGIVVGDFSLDLSDCYRVATPRTHRLARRLELSDRRLATTPRDYRRLLYSTDFSTSTALARHFLPTGATDVLATDASPLTPATRAAAEGDVPLLSRRPHGDVVHFLQAAADRHRNDVVVLDRRGILAPTFTLAGDADPQAVYGWEEVYGPDHVLTDDVPVLQNGLCRLRWLADRSALALDAFAAGTGYVEQGRLTLWTQGAVGGPWVQATTRLSVVLREWTREHAVLWVALSGGGRRVEAYVSLERGWTGPRVELYTGPAGASAPGAAVRYSPQTNGDTVLGRSTGTDSSTAGWNEFDRGNFSSRAPWAYLLPPAPDLAAHFAVLQAGLSITTFADSAAYGTARNAAAFESRYGSSIAGYASVTLGLGARGQEAIQATELSQTNLYDARAIPAFVAH